MTQLPFLLLFFFFFNDTATTEIYTLSLHDALPISTLQPKQPYGRRQCQQGDLVAQSDRKSTRLNSSHMSISYAVFCLKKKNRHPLQRTKAGTAAPRTRGAHEPGVQAAEGTARRRVFFFLRKRQPPRSTLFPYTTLFR